MNTEEDVYEVLADELTIHKLVAELPQENGGTIRQNGMGKVWLKTELVPASEISPDYIDALNDPSNVLHKHIVKKLKKASGNSKEDIARRLSLPFEGIDDMDESELLQAMKHLPSVVISRIKEYEEKQTSPRSRIVEYNIGFGEDPDARQLGESGSPINQPEEGKPSSELETRSIPPDGKVIQGDGVTGIGVASKGKLKNPGAVLTGDKKKVTLASKSKKSAPRAGRRARTTKSEE